MKITRSYSRKLNIGNYQTLDHLCSVEQEVDDVKDVESISEKLEEFCVKEVEKGIEKSKKELEKPKEEEYQGLVIEKELNFKDVKLNESN